MPMNANRKRALYIQAGGAGSVFCFRRIQTAPCDGPADISRLCEDGKLFGIFFIGSIDIERSVSYRLESE